MKNTKLDSIRVASALVLALSGSQMLSPAAFATHKSTTPSTPVVCTTADIQINSRNADLSQVVVALKSSAAQKDISCDVSLNSYKTDGPTWPTSGIQALIDHKTVTLTKTNTTASLTVQTAPCFGQNDLYIGSTRFDGVDGALPQYPNGVFPTKLITAWNGGKACAETVPPPATTVDHTHDRDCNTPATPTMPETPTTPTTPATPEAPVTTPQVAPETPRILAASTTTPATLPASLPVTGSSTQQSVILSTALAAFAFGIVQLLRARFASTRNN